MSISRKALIITFEAVANIATAVRNKRIDNQLDNLETTLNRAVAQYEEDTINLSVELAGAKMKLLFLDGYLKNALTEDQYNHLKEFGYL